MGAEEQGLTGEECGLQGAWMRDAGDERVGVCMRWRGLSEAWMLVLLGYVGS